MKSFIITLFCVAIINAVVTSLSPEGDIKKYVRIIGALCMLLSIVGPVFSGIYEGEFDLSGIFDDESRKEEYEDIYENALLSGSISMAEEAIALEISESFQLEGESFTVSFSTDNSDGNHKISSAVVYLRGSAVFADPRKIAEYINERVGCECTVIYE